MAIESLASMLSSAEVMLYVPPVTLTSSLPVTPLPCAELIVRAAVPLSTRSSFEKITASVLVSLSVVNAPVTESVLSAPVVTKHLSADTT